MNHIHITETKGISEVHIEAKQTRRMVMVFENPCPYMRWPYDGSTRVYTGKVSHIEVSFDNDKFTPVKIEMLVKQFTPSEIYD